MESVMGQVGVLVGCPLQRFMIPEGIRSGRCFVSARRPLIWSFREPFPVHMMDRVVTLGLRVPMVTSDRIENN